MSSWAEKGRPRAWSHLSCHTLMTVVTALYTSGALTSLMKVGAMRWFMRLRFCLKRGVLDLYHECCSGMMPLRISPKKLLRSNSFVRRTRISWLSNGSVTITHGCENGLMKTCTIGLWCRVACEVSQHCLLPVQVSAFTSLNHIALRHTNMRFVRLTCPIISGISPSIFAAASLLYGMPGIGRGRAAR